MYSVINPYLFLNAEKDHALIEQKFNYFIFPI